MTSPEISREVGGFLAEKFPHLIVDVHNPDLVVTVEVRDYAAFIRGAAKRVLAEYLSEQAEMRLYLFLVV